MEKNKTSNSMIFRKKTSKSLDLGLGFTLDFWSPKTEKKNSQGR